MNFGNRKILKSSLKKELKKIWLVILFEENKWEKCKARIRGVKDGFRLDIKKENNK